MDIDHFLEEKEELPVSLRLELLQAVEDEVYDGFQEHFVIDGQVSDVVKELV